jgi:hypothetical protein
MSAESGLRVWERDVNQRIPDSFSERNFRGCFSTSGPSVFGVTICDSNESKLFTHVKNAATGLQAFDMRSRVSARGAGENRQHSIALSRSIEHFLFPRDLLTVGG